MFEIKKLEEDGAVMLFKSDGTWRSNQLESNKSITDQADLSSIKQRQVRQEYQEATPDLEEQIKTIIN